MNNIVTEEFSNLKVASKTNSKQTSIPSFKVPVMRTLEKHKSDNSRLPKVPPKTDVKQRSLKIVRRDEVVPKISVHDSEFIELIA
jgi:hypothetical protein